MSAPPNRLGGVGDAALRASLRRQYGAALRMLREALATCPPEAWNAAPVGVWQLAYHALFFTHLYLMPDEASFAPWPGHRGDVQHGDGLPGPADPDDHRPLLPPAYAQDDVLAYLAWIEERLERWIAMLDLASASSGFSWYPVPKLDHQLVNLRHLQHHAAQVVQRVRDAGGDPGGWIAAEPMPGA